ncbi:hypothetical protein [uncultured Cyclobacterium sp.]|uniref:hypothetical protein n=1 Tax=uncultured Cyclobacterium sp. TaxID=453820 RepID=UPI0030EC05ED|tara:strand:+ start:25694 stop:26410 length:717 start_codon:yes stop_codon:yes gene_type:complete
MKIKYLLLVLCVFIGFSSIAQTFSPAFQGYSRKKTTYITLKDGSELSVVIKKLFFKKGLIDDLKVEKSSDGQKIKINPEDIDHMYVPPSALSKISQKLDASSDLQKIQDNELSGEHLDDGYLYMESSNVQVKKNKTQYCMMQVMNPTFSKKIKVYNDPFAKESASIGFAGMTVAGGLDKSYYIKKNGEDIARRIKKKEYKKDIEELFAECPAVIEKYKDSPKWMEFEEFIYDYSTLCD